MKDNTSILEEYKTALTTHQELFRNYETVYRRWSEATFSQRLMSLDVTESSPSMTEVRMNIDYELFRRKLVEINPFLKPPGHSLTLAEEAFVQSMLAASGLEYAHPGMIHNTITGEQLTQFGYKWRYQTTRSYFINVMRVTRTFAGAEATAQDLDSAFKRRSIFEINRYLQVWLNEKCRVSNVKVLSELDKQLPEKYQPSNQDEWTIFRMDINLAQQGTLQESMGGVLTLH